MTLKSKRVGITSIIISLFIVFSIVVVIVHQHNRISSEDAQTADYVAANNIATRSEYLRIVRLQKTIIEDRQDPLTEQDVKWLLAFANNPRFHGEPLGLRQLYVSGVLQFARVDQLPMTCRQGVYDFGVELVHDPDPYGFKNALSGCRILGSLGNKNAIPELQPLLQSKDGDTRRFAAVALDDLGVEVPPSSYIDHH